MDHLIDNPSDVVGLELGPGDEPLLPGTLLPMRNVRATDTPPPPICAASISGSGTIDVGGSADAKPATAKVVEQPTDSLRGVKTSSMRR